MTNVIGKWDVERGWEASWQQEPPPARVSNWLPYWSQEGGKSFREGPGLRWVELGVREYLVAHRRCEFTRSPFLYELGLVFCLFVLFMGS